MRVVVEQAAGRVRIEAGAVATERGLAEGVVVLFDAAERIVGVELHGIDSASLGSVTVSLAGVAGSSMAAAGSERPERQAPPSALAPPPPYDGALTWEPEAEAAMLRVPFFNRGRHRLAASALARRRGLDRVTLDVVQSAGS